MRLRFSGSRDMERRWRVGPDGVVVDYEIVDEPPRAEIPGTSARPGVSEQPRLAQTAMALTPRISEALAPSAPAAAETYPCRYCGQRIALTRLKKHYSEVHNAALGLLELPPEYRQKLSQRSEPETTATWGGQAAGRRTRVLRRSPSGRPLSTCPRCGQWVRVDRLEYHTLSAHGRAAAKNLVVGKNTARSDGERCEYCGAFVLKENLKRHIAKVHAPVAAGQTPKPSPLKAKRRTVPKPMDSPVFPVGPEPTRKPPEDTRYGRPLDGSWGFGKYRREFNGRWGSYPSFDDYSEEAFE